MQLISAVREAALLTTQPPKCQCLCSCHRRAIGSKKLECNFFRNKVAIFPPRISKAIRRRLRAATASGINSKTEVFRSLWTRAMFKASNRRKLESWNSRKPSTESWQRRIRHVGIRRSINQYCCNDYQHRCLKTACDSSSSFSCSTSRRAGSLSSSFKILTFSPSLPASNWSYSSFPSRKSICKFRISIMRIINIYKNRFFDADWIWAIRSHAFCHPPSTTQQIKLWITSKTPFR